MTGYSEQSAREDDCSIFYVYRRGWYAVTLTVLKVGGEFIGCDVSDHAEDVGSDQTCPTLGMPGTCIGHSLGFSKSFYAALQTGGKTERVDDERVFGALAAYLHGEFGVGGVS